MRRVRIRRETDCPFCDNTARRVCYSYDKTESCAVYYCDKCGGTFTLVIERKKDKNKGWFGFR